MTLYNKSGVYVIENLVNGKYYIGSSKNLGARKVSHFGDLKRKNHHCPPLQFAYNKYGRKAFKFFVLEFCDEKDKFKKEQNWLDVFFESDECYNTLKDAEHPKPTLHKKWTTEEKNNLKKALLSRNFKHSPETVEKMRQRMSDPLKNPMSNPLYRQKIADKRRKLDDEVCKCVAEEYMNNKTTQMQLAKKYNSSRMSIRTCIRIFATNPTKI